jgi:hypothetical protein
MCFKLLLPAEKYSFKHKSDVRCLKLILNVAIAVI